MRVREVLCESMTHDNAKSIIQEFIEFAVSELGLKQRPKIILHTNNKYSAKYRSFGSYGNGIINVTITNRHINDCLRTLAHELVHFKQDLNGQLTMESGATGSPEENEANSLAAVVLRKWGKKYPIMFGHQSIE